MVGGFVAEGLEQPTLQLGCWFLSFLAGGVPAAIKAARSLVEERKLDVDLLMVVAALGAASVGRAGDGAVLLFLFSLSNALQSWAMRRTRRAIEALMTLHPEGASVLLPDGREEWRPLEALQPGDVLLVRPGERFAADGTVLEGYTDVDESALTGESVPVDKRPGDQVKSGTLNGHGVVRVRVERPAGESTLAQLIRLVERAQASKSRTERFAERFEGPYTVVVLLSAPVIFALTHFVLGLGAGEAWYRAMTFLVVASPCAVVIATPAAVLSAMAAGARAGVLFKSGAALEALAQARIFAFDKTGTLTEGRMRLVRLDVLYGSKDEALALAAGIERYSEHPIAQAIVQAHRGPVPEVREVRAIRGHGVVGALADGRQ
ncbi:MAG: heavy metal translocating P-type ATPase, partial [Deinococcus-Thermus bacterium]